MEFKFETDLIKNLINKFFETTIKKNEFKNYLKWECKNGKCNIYYILNYLFNILKNFKYKNLNQILFDKFYNLYTNKFFVDDEEKCIITLILYILDLKIKQKNILKKLNKIKIDFTNNFKKLSKNNKIINSILELLIKFNIINEKIFLEIDDFFKEELNFAIKGNFNKIKEKLELNLNNDKKDIINVNENNRKSNFYNDHIKKHLIEKNKKEVIENVKLKNIDDKLLNKNSSSIVNPKKDESKNHRNIRKSFNFVVQKKKIVDNNLLNLKNLMNNLFIEDNDFNKFSKSNTKTKFPNKNSNYYESKSKYSVVSKIDFEI